MMIGEGGMGVGEGGNEGEDDRYVTSKTGEKNVFCICFGSEKKQKTMDGSGRDGSGCDIWYDRYEKKKI